MRVLVALLVGLLGAVAGFLLAVILAYLTYKSDNDALVWVAALFGFSFILMPIGVVVALILLRGSRKRTTHSEDVPIAVEFRDGGPGVIGLDGCDDSGFPGRGVPDLGVTAREQVALDCDGELGRGRGSR